MPTILFSAPYMIPSLERFQPVFDRFNLELIVPDVNERLEESQILAYAGHFDGAICGDDHFTARVLEECSP
jgi:D-3-phosphoglycerate dehydrogenase